MSCGSPDSRPLQLISALCSALNHALRSPLSVISNDLHYLRTLTPTPDTERPLRRCYDIATLLTQYSTPALPLRHDQITLREFGYQICTNLPIEVSIKSDPQLPVVCDLSLVSHGMRTLAELFLECVVTKKPTLEIHQHTTGRVLKFSDAGSSQLETSAVVYDSLTTYVTATSRALSPKLPIADAVIWAHGGVIRLTENIFIVELP